MDMPRTIKAEEFDAYRLDELWGDAREKAVAAVAEKLGGEWWDSADIDDIDNVIRYTLASEFGTLGHGDYGVGDFPGIDGVELDGWGLDGGGYLQLRGALTRENAPALPWADGLVEVGLHHRRERTEVDVVVDEEALDPGQDRDPIEVREDCKVLIGVMDQAVRQAMHAALKSGREEMDYKTSEGRAEDLIQANGYEFLADGTLYLG